MLGELVGRRPAPEVLAWFVAQPAEALFASVLTLGEIEQGIAKLDPADVRRPGYAAGLVRVETTFAGRILPIDAAAARRWGMLSGARWREMRQRSPAMDAMLAAQAIEFELILAMRNIRDFEGLGVAVFDPWSDDPARFPLGATPG